MNISELCIRRPVLTTLMPASLIVFGIFGYRLLPVAALPALDVQTALAVAQRRLPVEMTTPPFFRKVNPGDFPVLYVSLRSDTMPLSTVDGYAGAVLAPTLSQLNGVAQVLVYGAQKFAVRVQVDPRAAAARNIALDDIRTVVAKAKSSPPDGTLLCLLFS